MTYTRPLWMLLLVTGVAACGAPPPEEGAERAEGAQPPAVEQPAEPAGEQAVADPVEAAEPTGDRMQGRVVLTGTSEAPMVSLRPESGTSVNLTGELLPELRRLSGATIAVVGSQRGTGLMAQFAVTRYEIVDIDGQRPAVGLLQQADGGFRVGTTALTAVPAALGENIGAKVWVTGVREGAALRVQSFGIIRYP